MKLKKRITVNNSKTHIAILEPSEIVYEGIATLIMKAKRHTYIYWLNTLSELDNITDHQNINIVIVNPSLIHNKESDFIKYKKQHLNISWIAFVYSYFNDDLLQHFSDRISITDNTSTILKKLDNSLVKSSDTIAKEQLTDREKDVLLQLVKGLSNKEIANVLHISTHTVISHRKNIIEKTGIRSLPGLTIFALSQKIITVDQVS